ncbi:MAG TPA: hypothetical protein VF618_23065 [Thermoanaerobaculia bacterium]
MKRITSAAAVRFRKFAPIDRESPLFEALYEEEVLLDIGRADGLDLNSEFDVAFYPAIAGVQITAAALTAIVAKGVELVTAHEDGSSDSTRRGSSAESMEQDGSATMNRDDPFAYLGPAVFYLQSAEALVMDRGPRHLPPHPDICCLSPVMLAITDADGVWEAVNRRCGTAFELFEEEQIAGNTLISVAELLEGFGARYGAMAEVHRVVAVTDGVPVEAVVQGTALEQELRRLAAFLRRAALEVRTVFASL